jgi:hypothetical protein
MTNDEAATIKGMLARGDKNQWIVAWFGGEFNPGRVAEISTGKTFADVAGATRDLPPRGPYASGKDAYEALLVLQPMLEAQLAITEKFSALQNSSVRHCKSIQQAIDSLKASKNGK